MLKTFNADGEMYEQFRYLCVKERVKIGAKINQLIENYVKEHGDGNPQYTMDQFEDPDFVACPAFYRDTNIWKNYMEQATPEELEKLKSQIIKIDHTLARFI